MPLYRYLYIIVCVLIIMHEHEVDLEEKIICNDEKIVEQKEVLELTKNTKGYNWKIRVNAVMLSDAEVLRLERINRQMNQLYGDGNGHDLG